MNRKEKILVIGLDGGTYKKLGPWMQSNQSSFISKVYRDGTHGNLETFFPTITTLSWPCFFTGKNPGKLGIYGFTTAENVREIDKVEKVANFSDIESASLWRVLSKEGKRVGIVNIPVTYPPEEIKGFLITGFLTPPSADDYTFPKELINELHDYQIDLTFEGEYGELPDSKVDKKELLQKQIEITKNRTKNALQLIDEHDLDFFAIDFKGWDTVQHLFWNNDEILWKYYRVVSNCAKKLYEKMKPAQTIFMSDHGFHPSAKKYFFVNTWLRRKGYLTGKNNRILDSLLSFGIKIGEKLDLVRELLPTSTKENLLNVSSQNQISFENSKAYGSRWGIFINGDVMKGNSEYISVRNQIEEDLKNLKDPQTDRSIVKDVIIGENHYQGAYANKLPDLIPVLKPNYKALPILSSEIFHRKIDKPYITGQNKSDPEGILIASGKGINTNSKIKDARIIDLYPTILHILGIPVPEDIDGKVLDGLFKKNSEYNKEVEYQSPLDTPEDEKKFFGDEEEEEVKKRLEQLGYF